MIKPYAVSIARQLTLIFQNSLAVGTFPLIGKKQVLFRFIKRKQETNCFKLQSSSLLPIGIKIIGKLIFNELALHLL